MPEIETILHYRLTDYEEAAFLLSRYFIQRGYQADLYRSREVEGGYSALISKRGFLKGLLGSRTTIEVTFYPTHMPLDRALPHGASKLGDNANSRGTDTNIKVKSAEVQPAGTEGVWGHCCTGIKIRKGFVTDGAVKEFITYVTVIPALRKLGDFITMQDLAKKRSLIICDRLKEKADGDFT